METEMTRQRQIQQSVVILALAGAVSALAGGIALLIGVIEFPLDWLDGTIFEDYTIPALVLAVIVGGSQVIAALSIRRSEGWGSEAALAAGLVMMGWIVGEIAIVGSEAGIMRALQAVYFTLGLIEAALAAWLVVTRSKAI